MDYTKVEVLTEEVNLEELYLEPEIDVESYDLTSRIESDIDILFGNESIEESSVEDEDIDADVDVATIDPFDNIPLPGVSKNTCFLCEKIQGGKKKIWWRKCKDSECFKLLCTMCFSKINGIKKNTRCLKCNGAYTGGKTSIFRKCENCKFWMHRKCIDADKCRCILRHKLSQHRF